AMIDTFVRDFAKYRAEMEKDPETLRKEVQDKDNENRTKDWQIETLTTQLATLET
ncbi:hypothetical protein HDU98_004666, partial [Podochytrium sp. JEL0797]